MIIFVHGMFNRNSLSYTRRAHTPPYHYSITPGLTTWTIFFHLLQCSVLAKLKTRPSHWKILNLLSSENFVPEYCIFVFRFSSCNFLFISTNFECSSNCYGVYFYVRFVFYYSSYFQAIYVVLHSFFVISPMFLFS